MGACTPLAVVDIDGSGKPASVSFHPSGEKFVSVTTESGQLVSPEVAPSSIKLTHPFDASEIEKGIQYYELDGQPGAEIVVPIGMNGSNSIFQVFTLRDGDIKAVSAPGDTFQLNLGSSFWVFPGERILARAICGDDGLSLGSTEMPSPKQGRVVDFESKPGSGAGEASEWVVTGRRTVDPSEITDMSVGQTHFKCRDVRIKSLDSAAPSSTAPSTTATSCDSDKDMSSTVREAIATLPTKNGWTWQTTADTSHLNPCNELSFATTTVEMATNSSPVAILLFNEGRFVGPASTCFPPVAGVVDGASVGQTGNDEVEVTYRYPEDGDSNADMTGRATLTFTWDGDKVAKSGDVPARLTQLAGCTP
ncbi:LppP/LprE family lipoprotein [Gordonia sp. MP11Mi]